MIKLIAILTVTSFSLYSQSDSLKNSEVIKQLDEIFIERDDVLNIKGGEKRKPKTIPSLSKSDLDSLNSLEKQQSLLLPTSGLPLQQINRANERAYINANYGRFNTFDGELGYDFSVEDFEFYSNANLEFSGGHLDNAGYFDGGFRLISDYVAPQKFFVFGGSKTRTRLNYNHLRFNNFAEFDSEERSLDTIGFMMDSEGDYNGFKFSTGAGFDMFSMNGDSVGFTDFGVKGYLKLINPYKSWRFIGDINTELRSGNNQSNNYIEGLGGLSYYSKNFDFYGNAGLQLAQNEFETILVPTFKSGIDLKSNYLFTLNGEVGSRLNRRTFANLSRENLYLDGSSFLDHTQENLYLRSSLKYHPGEKFNILIGAKYSIINNALNWSNIDTARFTPVYLDANGFKVFLETYYDIDENNTMTGFFEFNQLITDSLNNQNTYLPLFFTGFDLRSKLFDKFVANIGLNFVGERFADLENEISLDSYLNLFGKITYRLDNNLNIILNMDNLLNQNIYNFNFYRQRGTFVSLGMLWKF